MVYEFVYRVCLRYVSAAPTEQHIGQEGIISNGEAFQPIWAAFVSLDELQLTYTINLKTILYPVIVLNHPQHLVATYVYLPYCFILYLMCIRKL